MSEQHRPDPALPQNPQPSGGQGYPQQPAPAGQPMYGNAPAPAAELPEKPAYRGTVVAVLIGGIIAALLRIIDIIMGLYLHPQAKNFAQEYNISESELGITDSSPRGIIFGIVIALLFFTLARNMKKGGLGSAIGLTAVAGIFTVIYANGMPEALDNVNSFDEIISDPLFPEMYKGFFSAIKFGVYLELASIVIQVLLIILIWLPTTLKYMRKAREYYGAVEAQKPENQPVDASTLAVPASEGQAPVAQHNAQHVQNGQQGYGYDPQAPQNPQAQQNNVPQNPQNPQDHQGNSGYNLN